MASLSNPLFEAEPFQESQGHDDMDPKALEEFYANMERKESVKRKLSRGKSGKWRRNSKSGKSEQPQLQTPEVQDDGNESDQTMEKILTSGTQVQSLLGSRGASLGTMTPPPILPNALPLIFKSRYSLHDQSMPPIPWTNYHLLPPGTKPQPRPVAPSASSPAVALGRGGSSPDIASPSASLTALPLPANTSQPGPISSEPNNANGWIGPDGVDLLDGSDPWGMQWHHDGRYEVGSRKNNGGTGSSSWNGTQSPAEVPTQAQIRNRSSAQAPLAAPGLQQRRLAPSPLSQSMSAIPTEASTFTKVSQKSSKQETKHGGLLALFGGSGSPTDEKSKSKDLGDVPRVAVPSHPMPLGRRPSASPTTPTTPTAGVVSQPTLIRKSSKGKSPSSISVFPPHMIQKEKRLSVFGRLAKKLSIITRELILDTSEKRSSLLNKPVKRSSTTIQMKRDSSPIPHHGPRAASMPAPAHTEEPVAQSKIAQPRVPPPTLEVPEEEKADVKPAEKPPPQGHFRGAAAREPSEGRSSPELPELGRLPGLKIANPDMSSEAEGSPQRPAVDLDIGTSGILQDVLAASVITPRSVSSRPEREKTPISMRSRDGTPEKPQLSHVGSDDQTSQIETIPSIESPQVKPLEVEDQPYKRSLLTPSHIRNGSPSRHSGSESTSRPDSIGSRTAATIAESHTQTQRLAQTSDGFRDGTADIGSSFLFQRSEDVPDSERKPLERRVSSRLNPPASSSAPLLDSFLSSSHSTRTSRSRPSQGATAQSQAKSPLAVHAPYPPAPALDTAPVQPRALQQYQPLPHSYQQRQAPQPQYVALASSHQHAQQYIVVSRSHPHPHPQPPPQSLSEHSHTQRQRYQSLPQSPPISFPNPNPGYSNPLPPPPALITSPSSSNQPIPYTYVTVPIPSSTTQQPPRPSRSSARQRANSSDSIISPLRMPTNQYTSTITDPPVVSRPRALSTNGKNQQGITLGRASGAAVSATLVKSTSERPKLSEALGAHRKNASDTISALGKEWEVVMERSVSKKRPSSKDANRETTIVKNPSLTRATATPLTRQTSPRHETRTHASSSQGPLPSLPSKRPPPTPQKEDPPPPVKTAPPAPSKDIRETKERAKDREREKDRDREKKILSQPLAPSPSADTDLMRARSRVEERSSSRLDRSSPTKRDRASPTKVIRSADIDKPQPPRPHPKNGDSDMVVVGKETWEREKMKLNGSASHLHYQSGMGALSPSTQPPQLLNMSIQRSRTSADDDLHSIRPEPSLHLGSSHTSFIMQSPGQAPIGPYYNSQQPYSQLPYAFTSPPISPPSPNPLPPPPRTVPPNSSGWL